MDRTGYGSTAALIGQISDPAQLQNMLRNPQYAGFTNIIIARLTELNHLRAAPAATAPPAPTVAQQAVQGISPPQALARGGIVAFKHGGKVRKFAKGDMLVPGIAPSDYDPATDPDDPNYDPVVATMKRQGKSPATYATAESNPSVLRDIGTYFWGQPAAPIPDRVTNSVDQYNPKNPSTILNDPKHPFTADDLAHLRFAGHIQPESVRQVSPNQQNYFPAASQAVPGGITALPVPATQTAADDEAMYAEYMGSNPDLEEARTQNAALLTKSNEQAKQNPYMAMIGAGLGMAQAASANPRQGFFGNLAAGAQQGLTQFAAGEQQRMKEMENALQRQVQLGQISRQEAADKLHYFTLAQRTREQVAERAQQAKDQQATALEIARMQTVARSGLSTPADLDALANMFANQDTDRSTNKPRQPLPFYKLKALRELNASMYGAGLREDTQLRNIYENATAKKRAAEGPTAYIPSFEEWQNSGGETAAPTVMRD